MRLSKQIVTTLILFSLLLPLSVDAQSGIVWYVAPAGSGAKNGTSAADALAGIQAGINAAQPGDTVLLADGVYTGQLKSVRHGRNDAPITIIGSDNAILRNPLQDMRVFQINHDYLRLDGWTIDGGGKLIFILGTQARNGPTGVRIRNMELKNALGECVRLRYFVTDTEVNNNSIHNCGIADFVQNAGGKNGEGVYIGTADDQWGDGKNPTNEPDISERNWVHHNVFNTQGNECVDIKEGAMFNIIEHNDCTGQKDPNSAGFDSRGNGNMFRYNKSYGNVGAGVRLGGDLGYGTGNHVYGNEISANQGGGIKFQARIQGVICGNVFGNQANPSTGSYGGEFSRQVSAPCQVAPIPTNTPVAPTATPAIANTPTATPIALATATSTPGATAMPDVAPDSGERLYFSFNRSGEVGGVKYRDEDILQFNTIQNGWLKYMDGGDYGISGDIDGFAIQADGGVLFTLDDDEEIDGLGEVERYDVLHLTVDGVLTLYLRGEGAGLDDKTIDGFDTAAVFAPFGMVGAASLAVEADEPTDADIDASYCTFLPTMRTD